MRRSISLVAIAAGLALAGCEQSDKTAASAKDATSNFADAAGSAISNTASDVKEAITPTPTGQQFVDTAAKSDAFEIASAKLARDKASSGDIKAFAAMMVEDHTASTAKIKKAASAASPALKPDATLTSDQQGKLDTLAKLSGQEFDKTYADQQVGAHKAALALMKLYADKGEVAPLKAAAGAVAPKVETHLSKIEAIKKTL